MRKSGANEPERARMIKEGVDLAVKLADRLNTKANLAKKRFRARARRYRPICLAFCTIPDITRALR